MGNTEKRKKKYVEHIKHQAQILIEPQQQERRMTMRKRQYFKR